MTLVCINPFGNFVPGDHIDVPDGANFDQEYWRQVDEAPPAPAAPKNGKGDA